MRKKIKHCSELVRRWAEYPSKERIENLVLFRCRALDYSKEDLVCFIIYQEEKMREMREENTLQRGDLIFGDKNLLRKSKRA